MASPPHLPQLNIPRKRGSISSVSSTAKKRKPSQLRNAFSPETEGVGSPLRYSRSPSVDSVATGSLVNAVGGRKRKRKDGDAQSATGSVRGGKARSATTGVEGEGNGQEEQNEEEEDDDIEEMDAVLEGGKSTEATRRQEAEHLRLLIDNMSQPQKDRHETYRRIRLKRETVRKLVNQTLSQSVPQPVIIAVTSYSKAFIGEIVDRALTVRDEWTAARSHRPNPAHPPGLLRAAFQSPRNHKPGQTPGIREINEEGLQDRLKLEDKGPLTPAHLREALRRYKRDREGGGAGFAGMSLEGVERTMARTGGRRLFR